ncbi:hypothetical protein BHM03_00045850 [Ensete ventricosum]|nr:hypothetical protein BHM03_00045850 [Ensete ventricosum]
MTFIARSMSTSRWRGIKFFGYLGLQEPPPEFYDHHLVLPDVGRALQGPPTGLHLRVWISERHIDHVQCVVPDDAFGDGTALAIVPLIPDFFGINYDKDNMTIGGLTKVKSMHWAGVRMMRLGTRQECVGSSLRVLGILSGWHKGVRRKKTETRWKIVGGS